MGFFSKSSSKQKAGDTSDWIKFTKENPTADWKLSFWGDHRILALIDAKGVVHHIIFFMYFPYEKNKENAAERKALKAMCRNQLEVMFGKTDAKVMFSTTDVTAAEYLEEQAEKQEEADVMKLETQMKIASLLKGKKATAKQKKPWPRWVKVSIFLFFAISILVNIIGEYN